MSVIEKLEKLISEYEKEENELGEYSKGRLAAYRLILTMIKEQK